MSNHIHRKIWSLFWSLVAFGLFVSVLLLAYRYGDLRKQQMNRLRDGVETLAQSETYFKQYELLLDALGQSVRLEERPEDSRRLRELMRNLLQIDPTISAFCLMGPDGRARMSSADLPPSAIPNPLKNPVQRDGFVLALRSRRMVIGVPCDISVFGGWVLPLRKTLRDETGKAVGVLVVSLRMSGMSRNVPHPAVERINSILVHSLLRYHIYASSATPETYRKWYGEPVPQAYIEGFKKIVREETGHSMEWHKRRRDAFPLEWKDLNGVATMAYVTYLPDYRLWALATLPKRHLYAAFARDAALVTVLFFLVAGALYIPFLYVVRSERRRYEELRHKATHDSLTGLPNRYALYEEGREWIEKETPFCLVYCDMDHFKNVNDTMGHELGDKVLQQVGERLRAFANDKRFVYRYGGDEFVLMVLDCQTAEIEDLAEEVGDALRQPYRVGRFEFSLGVSMGIALHPQDGESVDALVSASDVAMYRAKRSGENHHFFTHELLERRRRIVAVEHALRHALERGELFVVYQPQISSDGRLRGVEALLRWKSPELGYVSPAEFIPIAEETGIIMEMGRFVIARSIREMSELEKRTGVATRLSINISVKQFAERDFISRSYQQVQEIGFDPERICVELTESVFIDDVDYILEELRKISDLRVKLSLDDFGTGYSSLSLVQRLPIDELKIDRSFVDNMLEEKNAGRMVRSILSMAKAMGLEVVAEGVENANQARVLRELGCDAFQGYFFAQPMRMEELERFVREEAWRPLWREVE